MPKTKRVVRGAAALQRAIVEAGDEAQVISAEIVLQKQEPTEAQKQLKAERARRLESKFAGQWRARCPEIELLSQYRFDETRRWRFDFAVPAIWLAIEIDGGTWSDERSGHTWGKGVTNDYEKQNAAMIGGWAVFRFTSDMVSGREIDKYLTPVIEHARREMHLFTKNR